MADAAPIRMRAYDAAAPACPPHMPPTTATQSLTTATADRTTAQSTTPQTSAPDGAPPQAVLPLLQPQHLQPSSTAAARGSPLGVTAAPPPSCSLAAATPPDSQSSRSHAIAHAHRSRMFMSCTKLPCAVSTHAPWPLVLCVHTQKRMARTWCAGSWNCAHTELTSPSEN